METIADVKQIRGMVKERNTMLELLRNVEPVLVKAGIILDTQVKTQETHDFINRCLCYAGEIRKLVMVAGGETDNARI